MSWRTPCALGVFVLSLTILIYLENFSEWAPGLSQFAFEYGHIAAALAEGRGFSDPFGLGTGATAWMPPFFCYYMAAVFGAFGVKTIPSLIVLLLTELLGLTLAAALLMASARRTSGESRSLALLLLFWVGLTLHPAWLCRQLFDQWLIMLTSSLMIYSFVSQSTPWTLVCSFFAPLISPNLALGFGLAHLFSRRLGARAICSVWFCLSLSSGLWCLRNFLVLGVAYPIKSNAGYEFFQANAWSEGRLTAATLTRYHPSQPGTETRQQYLQMGEGPFCQSYAQKSLQLWRERPADMTKYVLKRASDSLLYVRSADNLFMSSPDLCLQDKQKLDQERWLLALPRYQIWLAVTESESSLRSKLENLHLADTEAAIQSWKSSQRWIQRANSSSWRHFVAIFSGLLPTLAAIYALLSGRPWIRFSLVLYLAYLTPYILISHYERYQISAIALQAWIVWLASTAKSQSQLPSPE